MKYSIKLLCVLAIGLHLFLAVEAQKCKTISKDEAIEDIWTLKAKYEDAHPNLYSTMSEKEFSDKLNSVIKKLSNEVCVDTLYALLAPVVNQFHDGHTSLWRTKSKLPNEALYFPLRVDMFNYQIVSDSSHIEHLTGATLLKINGIEMDTIVNTMLPRVSGEKEYYKRAQLETMFPAYLYVVCQMKETFHIEYTKDGKIYESDIIGSSQKFFDKTEKDVEGDFCIEKADDGSQYAYLTLSMFGYSKGYYSLIDKSFEQLKNNDVEKLIIDIKNNPGGNSNLMDYLFQYISKSDSIVTYGSITAKSSTTARDFYRSYFTTKKPYLLPLIMCTSFYWKKEGIHTIPPEYQKVSKPEDVRYKGQVFLVTSHKCFSTADDFARAFKYNKVGVVVGEETGGMKDSYGEIVFFKLPHSKINCACSTKYYQGLDLNDAPRDGVMPDYEMDCRHLSKADIVNHVHHLKNY